MIFVKMFIIFFILMSPSFAGVCYKREGGIRECYEDETRTFDKFKLWIFLKPIFGYMGKEEEKDKDGKKDVEVDYADEEHKVDEKKMLKVKEYKEDLAEGEEPSAQDLEDLENLDAIKIEGNALDPQSDSSSDEDVIASKKKGKKQTKDDKKLKDLKEKEHFKKFMKKEEILKKEFEK